MLEMVEARRNEDKVEERYDLFSGLLDAAQDELDPKAALNEEELMGGYSILHHLEFRKYSIRDPRKHVHLSFCWI